MAHQRGPRQGRRRGRKVVRKGRKGRREKNNYGRDRWERVEVVRKKGRRKKRTRIDGDKLPNMHTLHTTLRSYYVVISNITDIATLHHCYIIHISTDPTHTCFFCSMKYSE